MDGLHLTGTVELETERLLLRRFTLDDAESMYANWAGDPEVARFLTWDEHADIDVTRAVLGRWMDEYNDPHTYSWAIVLKALGQPVGSIGLHSFDEQSRKAEVGYCIGRRWWGMGVTTEALRAVLRHALGTVGLNRVEAFHDVLNPGSGGVMRKAGMKPEGHFRQWKYHKGRYCDYNFYAMLREDWATYARTEAHGHR